MFPRSRALRMRYVIVVTTGLALAGLSTGCGASRSHRAVTLPPVIISLPSAAADHPSAAAGNPSASPEHFKTIRRVESIQRENFALLNDKAEPLPLSIRRVLHKPIFGTNWRLAHRLRLSLPGSFWLMPGRQFLCLLHAQGAHDVAAACAPIHVALAHGLVTVSLREASVGTQAERLIVGVVPNGTHGVVVHTKRVATSVTVVRHIFFLRDSMSEPPDVVSLR
jgi:hypothetical protein